MYLTQTGRKSGVCVYLTQTGHKSGVCGLQSGHKSDMCVPSLDWPQVRRVCTCLRLATSQVCQYLA